MVTNPRELVDEIEAIRAHNNRGWMDLVRLALEVAPERAKEILGRIAEDDAQIRDRLRRIAES